MPRLSEWWRRHGARRLLVLEAAVYMLAARVALKCFAFGRLTWFLTLRPGQPEIGGQERERTRKEVRRAIFEAARHLLGGTTCFQRAIAAQALLRRRGVGTTLYYGAATLPGHGLTTHVWVQDGDVGVVGHLVARRYHVLARYPAGARSQRS